MSERDDVSEQLYHDPAPVVLTPQQIMNKENDNDES